MEASTRGPGLPVLRVGEIPLEEAPRRWLIEGLWGPAAVGLIGGAPKSCKSWLGLDMAVSVVTGTPCLGRYRIEEPGAALVYLAEDALSVVRERVASIARSRGLPLSNLDLHVITAASLRLDQARDRERLFETAQCLRPRLLLLDPLVRLHAADENNATEMAQLLSYIRDLQRRLDLAVILIHHTRKYVPAGSQAGLGLRGSGDLHAFGDSNLYLRRARETLMLSMEHRAAAAPEPATLELITSDPATVHLEISRRAPQEKIEDKPGIDALVLQALGETQTMTRGDLRTKLSINNDRLGKVLEGLEQEGKITHAPGGWRRAES